MSTLSKIVRETYEKCDASDESVADFLNEWPVSTWRAGPSQSAAIATARTVVFAIKDSDHSEAVTVVIGTDEAQRIANTLSEAAAISIQLMLKEVAERGRL
ncbi:MAG: hypothetical protein ACU0C8_03770 [Roseovarius sp.]